jgi:hypothetical protein
MAFPEDASPKGINDGRPLNMTRLTLFFERAYIISTMPVKVFVEILE